MKGRGGQGGLAGSSKDSSHPPIRILFTLIVSQLIRRTIGISKTAEDVLFPFFFPFLLSLSSFPFFFPFLLFLLLPKSSNGVGPSSLALSLATTLVHTYRQSNLMYNIRLWACTNTLVIGLNKDLARMRTRLKLEAEDVVRATEGKGKVIRCLRVFFTHTHIVFFVFFFFLSFLFFSFFFFFFLFFFL